MLQPEINQNQTQLEHSKLTLTWWRRTGRPDIAAAAAVVAGAAYSCICRIIPAAPMAKIARVVARVAAAES